MKERPLIFSPWSVRRILEDKKTETRRVMDVPLNAEGPFEAAMDPGSGPHMNQWAMKVDGKFTRYKCPLGRVGDRIWVREPWYPAFKQTDTESGCIFKADYGFRKDLVRDYTPHGGWKSPLFLPRKFARIILELVDIQVERLQDMREQAAIAEGIQSELVHPPSGYDPDNYHPPGAFGYVSGLHPFPEGKIYPTAKEAYRELWDSLHIKDGHTWSTNPFIWVYKFRRINERS